MTVPTGYKGLRFPCECVSSRPGGYSDPWAEITKNKLLPNGTKEEILNVLAQGPKTITHHLRNRSIKINVHATHNLHAMPDLRIAGGRLGDDVSLLI
jgi:hypothetical protein